MELNNININFEHIKNYIYSLIKVIYIYIYIYNIVNLIFIRGL